MDIRSTGARLLIRPSTRIAAPSRRSALNTITQTVPTTMRRPDTIQVLKSIARSPKTGSSQRQGSIR